MSAEKPTSPPVAAVPRKSPLVTVFKLYSYACAVAVPVALAIGLLPQAADPPTNATTRTIKPPPTATATAPTTLDERPGLVYAGKDRWLFKDRAEAYRAKSVDSDAVNSVAKWSAWCNERGVKLVVVPVPDRGYLLRESLPGMPLARGHMEAVYEAMRGRGVEVIDTASILSAEDCALQDSHMRPSSFRKVARLVADRVKGKVDFGVPPAKVTFRESLVWETSEMAEQARVPRIYRSDETVCVFFEPGDTSRSPLVVMGDSNAFFYAEAHTSFAQQLGGFLRVAPHVVASADDGAGLESRSTILREQLSPKLIVWIFNEFALVNRTWR